MSNKTESASLAQLKDYQFEVRFGPDVPPLQADEPVPLGQGAGPSPVQLLAAAVGNCLSASLLFSWRKYKQEPGPIRCSMQAEVGRNADGHTRVLGLQATLTLGVAGDALAQRERVLDSFETYCTVTASVRQGIPVQVQVFDARGLRLK